MSSLHRILKHGICLVLLLIALGACGQGGTEVGNPNQPSGGQVPADGPEAQDATPSFEGPVPTPSPQSFLMKDLPEEDPVDDGALITPEET